MAEVRLVDKFDIRSSMARWSNWLLSLPVLATSMVLHAVLSQIQPASPLSNLRSMQRDDGNKCFYTSDFRIILRRHDSRITRCYYSQTADDDQS